jgi:hypothetical protein
MKSLRIMLAIIPLALLTDAIILRPANYGANSMGELAFLCSGVPILILNLWVWMYPHFIEVYFFGKRIGIPGRQA